MKAHMQRLRGCPQDTRTETRGGPRRAQAAREAEAEAVRERIAAALGTRVSDRKLGDLMRLAHFQMLGRGARARGARPRPSWRGGRCVPRPCGASARPARTRCCTASSERACVSTRRAGRSADAPWRAGRAPRRRACDHALLAPSASSRAGAQAGARAGRGRGGMLWCPPPKVTSVRARAQGGPAGRRPGGHRRAEPPAGPRARAPGHEHGRHGAAGGRGRGGRAAGGRRRLLWHHRHPAGALRRPRPRPPARAAANPKTRRCAPAAQDCAVGGGRRQHQLGRTCAAA